MHFLNRPHSSPKTRASHHPKVEAVLREGNVVILTIICVPVIRAESELLMTGSLRRA